MHIQFGWEGVGIYPDIPSATPLCLNVDIPKSRDLEKGTVLLDL